MNAPKQKPADLIEAAFRQAENAIEAGEKEAAIAALQLAWDLSRQRAMPWDEARSLSIERACRAQLHSGRSLSLLSLLDPKDRPAPN